MYTYVCVRLTVAGRRFDVAVAWVQSSGKRAPKEGAEAPPTGEFPIKSDAEEVPGSVECIDRRVAARASASARTDSL
jgi:hypothetical protein